MNILSAKNAAEFANIQRMDSRGRATHVLVPGHNGVWYEVVIARHKYNGIQVISTKCTCVKDKTPCKGNINKLCYHSLAAILAGAKKTKVSVSFCKSKEGADKLANIAKVSPCMVQSQQSQNSIWMIAKDLLEATMAC